MAGRLKVKKRFRLVFVNDNTLNTVWSLRLTRARVWLMSALCVAAIAALVVCVVVWSPVSYLLPGYMKPAQRRTTVDNTLRIDSLIDITAQQLLYIDNITDILNGADSITMPPTENLGENSDTLMTATDRERAFVEDWQRSERANLSVLTPILAEGMSFRSPVVGAAVVASGDTLVAAKRAPVVAIQDGMVIDAHIDAGNGLGVVIVQHANDFISIYGGLEELSVSPGRRVVAGQALGRVNAEGRLPLSIWHMGRRASLPQLLPI